MLFNAEKQNILTRGSMGAVSLLNPAQVTSVQQSVCTIKSTSLWFYSVEYGAEESQEHYPVWIMFC